MAHALRFPRACVSTPHYLASASGLEVLADGGNAVDAAVAANLTLGVVAPYLCGYGGDLFAMVWDGEAHGYLGGGRAPAAATPDVVRSLAGGGDMPARGPLTVTVPGAPRGWFDLLDRFGSRSFAELSVTAARHAREGVPLTTKGRFVLAFMADEYEGFDEWQRVYGDAGDRGVLVQPELAETIETLASGGPSTYYEGEIAAAIVGCVEDAGGLLDVGDLTAHEGAWVEPMRAPYRNFEVLELPPPTQGVTALEALRIVDRFGPLPLGGADRQHVLIEAVKLALADRDAHVSDPDHMALTAGTLLDDSWVDGLVSQIDPARAGHPAGGGEIPGGTASLCAADEGGLLVSLIQTNFNEFGSGLTVPGWGINLQNRGRAFSLDPQHVNVVAPRKRSLHTLIPAVALEAGRPRLVFGTMGADAQAQVHVQLLAHLVDEAIDLQEALDAPRWRVTPGSWSVAAETRFDPDLLDDLRTRGHEIAEVGPYFDYMGYAQAISVDENGYAGAADPRSEGAVVGR